MLRLVAAQAETLWDEALPIEVRELPRDLEALDGLLCDPGLLAPFVEHWQREALVSGVSAAGHGRPTIAIETYVRLMVCKHRHGWGYRTLVAEVSDSIHLRRFCRIALCERVPDESTVRKLTRRIGEETVNELTRALIESAVRERRFRARAVRIDSTVIEADIKYPTDAGLAAHGVRSLARDARRLAAKLGEHKTRVRDRSQSMGRAPAPVHRTLW
jgi:IS5 family transposase